MSEQTLVERMHAWIVSQPVALRVTLLIRVLLSVGFFAPGLTKLLGNRFVSIVTDDAVGTFFETLYQTGLYWRFLGAGQVLAAILVLSHRTAALGSLLFAAIILNIVVITLALPFGSTAVVALLMLLACSWLVAWEYPRWRALLSTTAPAVSWPAPRLPRLEGTGYLLAILGGWGATCVMRGFVPGPYLVVFWASLLAGAAGGILVLAAWIRAAFR